jgi:hypothetical protein
MRRGASWGGKSPANQPGPYPAGQLVAVQHEVVSRASRVRVRWEGSRGRRFHVGSVASAKTQAPETAPGPPPPVQTAISAVKRAWSLDAAEWPRSGWRPVAAGVCPRIKAGISRAASIRCLRSERGVVGQGQACQDRYARDRAQPHRCWLHEDSFPRRPSVSGVSRRHGEAYPIVARRASASGRDLLKSSDAGKDHSDIASFGAKKERPGQVCETLVRPRFCCGKARWRFNYCRASRRVQPRTGRARPTAAAG